MASNTTSYKINKYKRAIVALVLALVMLLTAAITVGYYSKGYTDWTAFGAAAYQTSDGELAIGDVVNSERVMLTATTASNENGYISKTLTATVSPAEASNKLVDWTANWADGATRADDDVTDYITITTATDGSNVATVTCIKAFDGDMIIITVTTRNGGYTATCTASYLGAPTTLSIDDSALTYVNDINWGVNIAAIDITQVGQLTLDLGLNNDIYGVISDDYTPDYTVDVQAYGTIIIKQQSMSTGSKSYPEYALQVATRDGVTNIGVGYGDSYDSYYIMATVKITDNQLIVADLHVASIISNIYSGPSGIIRYTFDSYKDNMLPYIAITVTDSNSGVSDVIRIRPISAVTSVSLDSPTIVF